MDNFSRKLKLGIGPWLGKVSEIRTAYNTYIAENKVYKRRHGRFGVINIHENFIKKITTSTMIDSLSNNAIPWYVSISGEIYTTYKD